MKFFTAPFAELWQHRRLLLQTSRNDVRAKYAGSVLGLSWLIFYPFLFLGVYALIYVFIFKVRFGLFDSNEYVALIFCGLIPFLGFAEALGLGVSSVTGNAALIKNTLFPIELIPVKAVIVSQVTQLMGSALLIITLGAIGKLSPWATMFPVLWLCQFLFTIGLIWILASLNVFFRDLQSIVTVIVLMLMMISPIAYTADMVPAGLRPLLALNPLYYIIISYQDVLMFGQFPRQGLFWILSVLSLTFFWLGYWFFIRMKSVFVDNV